MSENKNRVSWNQFCSAILFLLHTVEIPERMHMFNKSCAI